MIGFKRMWQDVGKLLSSNTPIRNGQAFEESEVILILDEDGEYKFVTKEDFVDFWCRMLYYNKVSKEQVMSEEKSNLKYVYEVIKGLPYIKEVSDILILSEE